MTEREVSEKEIDKTLETIMEAVDEKIDENLPQTIRLMAKLIFNLRYDLNELKLELIKVLKEDDEVTSIGTNGDCRNEEFYT